MRMFEDSERTAPVDEANTSSKGGKCSPDLYRIWEKTGETPIRFASGIFDPPVVGFEVLRSDRPAEIQSEATQTRGLPKAKKAYPLPSNHTIS